MPPLGGIFNWVKYGRTSINLILDSTGGRMGRITSFSKQVIVFFLVISLLIRPTFASTVGGWTLGGAVAQGASTVYNGTKQVIIDGKDYIKKVTANVTPTDTNVAKFLARGAAGYALSVAVEQLLGAVDWVLDPANNQVKYYPKPTDAEDPTSKGRYCFNVGNGGGLPARTVCSTQASDVCNAIAKSNGQTSYPLVQIGTSSYGPTYKCGSNWTLGAQANPAYDPSAEKEEKTIPLETVAQKVISNAESADTQAQVATTAAAADIVSEAEKDNVKARPIAQQLEASSSTKPADEAAAAESNTATGTQTQNPTKPDATDLKLEFPAFCGWAPIVCEAAQKVISFPITLTDWYETSKSKAEDWATSISEAWTKVKEEYANKPEENTDTQLDIEIPEQEIDTEINFGGACPAPLSSDINFMGLNKTIEFSFDPVCQIAEFIKPVVISISAFSAALIVAGIRTEDD
jgi:hypothetical protein